VAVSRPCRWLVIGFAALYATAFGLFPMPKAFTK
jgi:hypothetical protein